MEKSADFQKSEIQIISIPFVLNNFLRVILGAVDVHPLPAGRVPGGPHPRYQTAEPAQASA